MRLSCYYSNSFDNNAEKDTADCRAFFRKPIVIGDLKMAREKKNVHRVEMTEEKRNISPSIAGGV